MHVSSKASIFISAALLLPGCSSGVREERTIEFSSSGSQVGFQHGDSGVFLSNVDTGKAESIYSLQPGEIVASAPQFSADDSVIFAVASLDGKGEYAGDERSWDSASDGRRFFAAPTKYKCLYRKPGDSGQPHTLFDARCDHTGYIAANLAVRWHPDGQSIWYVDSDAPGSLAIFEYKIADESVRRITDFDAAAIAFDFSPGGKYVTCASLSPDGSEKIVRLSPVDSIEWKQLPQSGLAGQPTGDWLQQLRQALPHFSPDDTACVYEARLSETKRATDSDVQWSSRLVRYNVNSASATKLWESSGDIRDIHWHPSSNWIAFVDSDNQLQCTPAGEATRNLSSVKQLQASVRTFAGFSADGKWIAYTIALPASEQKSTYLFSTVDGARDQVFLAGFDSQNAAVTSPAAPAIEGMRLTFPHWSSEGTRLSLWATYAPSHTSRLSTIAPWSLAAGDPAAIVSASDLSVTWMPINPIEEAQIGHYFLLHRKNETAAEWYVKSMDRREPMEPIKLSQWQLFQQQSIQLKDATFFEYICLSRLGKQTEAQERLAIFDANFVLDEEDAVGVLNTNSQDEDDQERWAELVSELSNSCLPMLKAAYITEVYLSLNAADEGIGYFAGINETNQSPWQRYANALCHAHLILATGDRQRYASFVLSDVMPAFEAVDQPDLPTDGLLSDQADLESLVPIRQALVRVAASLAAAPLASRELTESLSHATLAELEQRFDALLALRPSAPDSTVLRRILLAINIAQEDSRAKQLREDLKGQTHPFVGLSGWLGSTEPELQWMPAE